MLKKVTQVFFLFYLLLSLSGCVAKLARVRVRECHRCSLTQMKVDAKDEARLKFMGLQMHEK